MKNENREIFRNAVFRRDNYRCVVPSCNKEAIDAHHLVERKLWIGKQKEGYLVDNGVSVCEEHHKLAEKNVLCPQVFRMWLNLPIVQPEYFDDEEDYNKWGETFVLPNRESAKYPSTSYLPFSENIIAKRVTSNPIANLNDFIGHPIVITMKMDGSNVVMTNHHVAARNGYDAVHKSFDYLKAIHASLMHLIPDDIEIFGEWLYAKHSIRYTNLSSLLQIFGVYDIKRRVFLGWDDVKKYSKLIGYPTTEVIDTKTFDNIHILTSEITRIAKRKISEGNEGVVIRSIYPFHFGQFPTYVAKYVRPNHVQTNVHWQNQKIVRNLQK